MQSIRVNGFDMVIQRKIVHMYGQGYIPNNPFESAEEAFAYLRVHGDEDQHYRYTDYDGETGMKMVRSRSYVDWALEVLPNEDLDRLLLSFDPNKMPTPVEEHLEDHINQCSTNAIQEWLEVYPKSSWYTHRPPILRHVDAGNTRSHLAQECIRVLYQRGIDIHVYTDPQYASPIREQAYFVLGKPFRSCNMAAKRARQSAS